MIVSDKDTASPKLQDAADEAAVAEAAVTSSPSAEQRPLLHVDPSYVPAFDGADADDYDDFGNDDDNGCVGAADAGWYSSEPEALFGGRAFEAVTLADGEDETEVDFSFDAKEKERSKEEQDATNHLRRCAAVLLAFGLRGPRTLAHAEYVRRTLTILWGGDRATPAVAAAAAASVPDDLESAREAAARVPADKRLGLLLAVAAAAIRESDGVYDARLRWALRRAAAVLGVEWSKVETGEKAIAATLLGKLDAGSKGRLVKGRGGISPGRWLKVGAGVTLGAGVLLVTGGLAAPLVAAAAGTILSAAGTVASAVGLSAVATAIAATAAQLSIVLSIPVITALFGATGAGLGGLRVYRRTSGVDEIVYAKVRDSLLTLPTCVADTPDATLAYAKGPGTAVPLATRSLALHNIDARLSTSAVRLSCAFDSACTSAQDLQLCEAVLSCGEWVFQPPKVVRPGESGVFAAKRTAFGARVAGCVVYGTANGAEGVCLAFKAGLVGAPRVRAMVVDLQALDAAASALGGDELVARCLDRAGEWEEVNVERLFPVAGGGGDGERMVVSASVDASGHTCTYSLDDAAAAPASAAAAAPVGVCLPPHEAGPQRALILSALEQQTRRVAATVANLTPHTLCVHGAWMDCGSYAQGFPLPKTVPPGECLLAGAHNRFLRPLVRGYMALRVVETAAPQATTAAAASCHGHFVLVRFTSDSSNAAQTLTTAAVRARLAASSGRNATQRARLAETVAERMPLTRGDVEAILKDDVGAADDDADAAGAASPLSVTVTCEGNGSDVRFLVRLDGEAAEAAAAEGLDAIIGVSGMTLHDDPRVGVADLQPLLWSRALSGGAWYVSWEEKLQAAFGGFMVAPAEFGSYTISGANQGAQQALKNPALAASAGHLGASYVVAAGVVASVTLPLHAIKASHLIDHTYTQLRKKAKESGRMLGELLLDRVQGQRPVTLVGVSVGANVIFHALLHLAAHPSGGLGLVESVVLAGSTVPVEEKRWRKARRVVAGRMVNVYSEHDWLLRLLHGGLSASLERVAGLSKVTGVPGVENVCVNHIAKSSAEYVRCTRAVLACVPDFPTEQTLSVEEAYPGRVVPVVGGALRREATLLKELGAAAQYLAVIVVNCLEDESLRLFDYSIDGGAWEHTPPSAAVPPGHAATMAFNGRGAVADVGFAAAATAVAVRVRLPLVGATRNGVEWGAAAASLAENPVLRLADVDVALGKEGGRAVEEAGGVVVVHRLAAQGVVVLVRAAGGEGDTAEEEAARCLQEEAAELQAGQVVAVEAEGGEESDAGVTAAVGGVFAMSPDAPFGSTAVVLENRTTHTLAHCWDYLVRCEYVAQMPAEVPGLRAGLGLVGHLSVMLRTKGMKGVTCYAIDGEKALLLAYDIPCVGAGALCASVIPLKEAGDDAAKWALSKLRYHWHSNYQQQKKTPFLPLSAQNGRQHRDGASGRRKRWQPARRRMDGRSSEGKGEEGWRSSSSSSRGSCFW